MGDVTAVAALASEYVERRDNFMARYRARGSGLFAAGVGGPMAFNELVNDNALRFAAIMPPMNLAQWEAVAELSNSYLNHLRMIEQQRGGKS